MKLFVIPAGTPVTLIDDKGNRKEMVSKCKACFSDYISDPVSEYNEYRRETNLAKYRLEPEMLSKGNKQYTMVEVDYDYVEVLC